MPESRVGLSPRMSLPPQPKTLPSGPSTADLLRWVAVAPHSDLVAYQLCTPEEIQPPRSEKELRSLRERIAARIVSEWIRQNARTQSLDLLEETIENLPDLLEKY